MRFGRFFLFFKKIGFLGILVPPYYGIGATIRIGQAMLCLPYAGFFRKTLFTLLLTFQTYFLIIPRSIRQIYVDLGKISTGSEKVATGSESHP